MSLVTPPSSQPERRDATRVGGARADFVAQLGRRVSELKQGLAALEADPKASKPRDELRRRLHALSSAARVLKFQAMAEQISADEVLLTQAAQAGTIEPSALAQLKKGIDDLPSLAWGDAAESEPFVSALPPPASAQPPSAPPPPAPVSSPPSSRPEITWPATALVIGEEWLAEALSPDEGTSAVPLLDCERTDNARTALDLARALAPDVVLLDGDLPGAEQLAHRLLEDPLTEPVPLVVVGSFSSPSEAARWVALGAARVLSRPVSPDSIHQSCVGLLGLSHRPPRPEELGTLTVEQLTARLTDELRRGLLDATTAEGRELPIDLGQGHEVLAALWSAVVRIRELTTIRSMGTVRFSPVGPEGALPVASWAHENRQPGSRQGVEPPPSETRLDGRTIVVADDDPAITWFLSGVLRAAGARVLEAHDGEQALALAYQASPDLVISDILMPKLDGFALCRALKRDVALRDVPVILLSWKEDLLQRVRELGAQADGYLRKEASASVVLHRVREVLRVRLRVESRLSGHGEVRGRLDDLTIHTLLRMVSHQRPDARVVIRDASFLYELELRNGAPRGATRTAPDGTFERGASVLGTVLGVGAGRFVVSASSAPLRGELEGSLDEQLRPAVARARAAQKLLSGTSLLEAHGIDIDLEALQPYFVASPQTSRSVLDKLAEGLSPRALLLRGGVPARLLEDVLADAAAHGAVSKIWGPDREELLERAAQKELSVIEKGLTEPLLPSAPPPEAVYAQPTPSPLAPLPSHTALPPAIVGGAAPGQPLPPPPAQAKGGEQATGPAAPSLPDAPPAGEPASEAFDLSSDDDEPVASPLATKVPATPSPMESAVLDALPPVAPASSKDEPISRVEPAPSLPEPPPVPQLQPLTPPPDVELRSEAAPARETEAAPPEPPAARPEPTASAREEKASVEEKKAPVEERRAAAEEKKPARGEEKKSAARPGEPAKGKPLPAAQTSGSKSSASALDTSPLPSTVGAVRPKGASWGWVALVLGGVTIGGWWFGRDVPQAKANPEPAPTHVDQAVQPSPAAQPHASSPAGSPAGSPTPAPEPGGDPALAASGEAEPPIATAPEDLALPAGESVPDGQGMLEILANRKDEIVVDRMDMGRGPRVKLTVAPGAHDVRTRRKGDDQPVMITVKPGRRTRVDLRGPWRR